MTAERPADRVGRWGAPAAAGQVDMVVRAAAPGAADWPRDRAGVASELPLEAQAGMAAVPAAVAGPVAPAEVAEVHKAAGPASEVPEPEERGQGEVGYRPWGPWAARRPGTVRSGCCPRGSSRCWISGRGSSAGAVAPAEDTVAGIEEVPPAASADRAVDKVADLAAGTAVAGRKREAPVAAAAGPSTSSPVERMAVPVAVHTAAEVERPEAPAEVAALKAP